MHNRNLTLTTIILIALFFHACVKNGVSITDRHYHESFDSLALSLQKGWVAVNNSNPVGSTSWQQGIYQQVPGGAPIGFPALAGTHGQTDYAYCDYTCASGLATISCWLISPVLLVKNGDTLRFWTRTVNPVLYPDRLQVRVNLSDNSADVGNDAESVGAFDILAFDINKELSKTGYPVGWKQYDWVVSGLKGVEAHNGRIAFRYYVPNGGPSPNSRNSDTIGLDEFWVLPGR